MYSSYQQHQQVHLSHSSMKMEALNDGRHYKIVGLGIAYAPPRFIFAQSDMLMASFIYLFGFDGIGLNQADSNEYQAKTLQPNRLELWTNGTLYVFTNGEEKRY